MDIRFMGTGAADFSPLLETAYKDTLDQNARRSSSILIDGAVLIDCGPHVLDSFRIQGLDMSRVTTLLITHFHDDHFVREAAEALAAQCREPLEIRYCADADLAPIEHANLHPVKPGEVFTAGTYQIRPLAANHTAFPLHYDIEDADGTRLFYGCDGAWVLYDTFYAMQNRRYDCMILDATVGDYAGDYRLGEHNSIPMLRLMAESFKTTAVIADGGVICLSHIARTLHDPHEILEKKAEKDGFVAAYDGLTVQITRKG